MMPAASYQQPATPREVPVINLINSIRAGVILYGPEGEVLYCNAAALSMLNIPAAEMYSGKMRHPFRDGIHPGGAAIELEDFPVQKAIFSGKPVENQVVGIHRRQHENWVWLQVNAVPVLDKNGLLKEVICSFTDITEQKEAAEKMEWLYKRLELRAAELATSNAELEKFVYAATHDLQEPLRQITSFVQLLQKKLEGKLDSQAKDYLRFVVEGSARMKRQMLDLQEYAGFGSSYEQFEETDMNDIAARVAHRYRLLLEETGTRFSFGYLPLVFADSKLMSQLLEKFLLNAIRHRNGTPLQVSVECLEEEKCYRFSVTDNGKKIEGAVSDQLFNLFQSSPVVSPSDQSGAGLAICQKIVRIHGGIIGLDQDSGEGNHFWFTIPKQKISSHEKL